VNVPTISFSEKKTNTSHDIWVRVLFGYLRGVGFGWVLVRFVLARFGFLPISNSV